MKPPAPAWSRRGARAWLLPAGSDPARVEPWPVPPRARPGSARGQEGAVRPRVGQRDPRRRLGPHVAFVDDGRPYCLPMLYARVGEQVLIHGSRASRLIRALADGAPACVTVTALRGLVLARSAFEHSANYECAIALGSFTAIDDPVAKRAAFEAFAERLVPGRWHEVRRPSTRSSGRPGPRHAARRSLGEDPRRAAGRRRLSGRRARGLGGRHPDRKRLWNAAAVAGSAARNRCFAERRALARHPTCGTLLMHAGLAEQQGRGSFPGGQAGGSIRGVAVSTDALDTAPPGHVDDFDFLVGRWSVHHRRLVDRLAGSTTWEEFDGECAMRKMLGGQANVDDNVLRAPAGTYHAMTVRVSTRAQARGRSSGSTVAIRPRRSRAPSSEDSPEAAGSSSRMTRSTGARSTARFIWEVDDGDSCRWQQACSIDGGRTWETNWHMDFHRIAP